MRKSARDILANTPLGRVVQNCYSRLELKVLETFHDDAGVMLIRRILASDGQLLCRPSEMYMVYSLALAQSRLNGDFAEVGVYKGATANVICAVKGGRVLHLFDTFDGLPAGDHRDSAFAQNMFRANVNAVAAKLSSFDVQRDVSPHRRTDSEQILFICSSRCRPVPEHNRCFGILL